MLWYNITTANADYFQNFSFTTFCQPESTTVISLLSDFGCINLCSVMAAIIARITRENRERILKRKHYVSVSKSVYNLKPFPERFNPKLHNKESTFLIIKIYFSLSCWSIVGPARYFVKQFKVFTFLYCHCLHNIWNIMPICMPIDWNDNFNHSTVFVTLKQLKEQCEGILFLPFNN